MYKIIRVVRGMGRSIIAYKCSECGHKETVPVRACDSMLPLMEKECPNCEPTETEREDHGSE